MKKGEAKIKEGIEPGEESVEQEEILELVQTVVDEHGTVRSKTYRNTKTGEETVETF